ncbi:MAG TPA: DUF932 domain-containing protein [Xanthobacteraceae bacterium]|nr:DUF932 domain-containing protein [Xanthobacteraceae bacterium]
MNLQFDPTRSFNRFGRGGASLMSRNGASLSNEEIAKACPSVFAIEKHESRSDRYTYMPTGAVIDGLRKEGFQPVAVRQGGSKDEMKRGFTKHMIRFRKSGLVARAVGDSVPEVCLLNSHDGTSAYELFMGWFRLICLNGMVVSDHSRPNAHVRVPHKGDVVGQVIDGAYRVIDEVDHVAEKVGRFQTLMLAAPEQQAFATAAAQLRFEGDSPIKASALNAGRRPEDTGNDLWRTFNRVQENLVRGGIGYSQANSEGRIIHRHTRPIQSVDGDVKLNRALWVLADEMAKLKEAA